MLDQDLNRTSPAAASADTGDDWEEAGDEEVPTVVLYIIAGMIVIAFTLYLVIGGGHGHFH